MEIKATLFDADNVNEIVEIERISLKNIKESQLLWVRIFRREQTILKKVCQALELKNVPLETILNEKERPKVDIFEHFYRFFIISVKLNKSEHEKRVPIDFLVGKNYIISISDGDVSYFNEFLEREKGERQIGTLDSESFVAALLDLHIVSYFRILEKIEDEVDKLDDRVLQTDMDDEEFLNQMVRLRNRVSKLRRWFLPHRDVFYALSRADFQNISKTDSTELFSRLGTHFENAVDAIESSRDTVLGLFDLYATKSAQKMNYFIQRLTFLTLIVGGLSVIAGVLGMNYDEELFKTEHGFEITVIAMLILALILTLVAKLKRWI